MEDTRIEWADHTFNPWSGCTKVSAGCRNCYAEALSKRVNSLGKWGAGVPRRRTGEKYWAEPLKWNAEAELSGRRPRVFCASLADWLDPAVPMEWLVDLLRLIHRTPCLDWLLLTKRPEEFGRLGRILLNREDKGFEAWLLEWLMAGGQLQGGDCDGVILEPPDNVWVGVSVEDQESAESRIPDLLRIPAKVRFLSCEPLLGPVDLGLRDVCSGWACQVCGSPNVEEGMAGPDGVWWHCQACGAHDDGEAAWRPDIHWVIAGGESGPNARPMHPDWARSLRDQCRAADVAFFFKQWGEYASVSEVEGAGAHYTFPDGATVRRVGKRAAGRLLGGVEHSEFPTVNLTGGETV